MLAPMLASLADAPLRDQDFVYEPKYDGVRAIVEIGRDRPVRLWSRRGNDKAAQFPEVASALARWAAGRRAALVLDGEIVALDAGGQPAGFQQLQGRIHLAGSGPSSGRGRVAFIAFDILRDGRTDYRSRPLLERREALERVFAKTGSPLLRISQMVKGDGRALYRRALSRGWEGLIAKRARSGYKSGKRTLDWRKLKIVHEQEFVVCGWTEPRRTRDDFGALLLGVYERKAEGARRLLFVGHTGTGFSEAELDRVMRLLRPLETAQSPFAEPPKTNERAHWVEPKLVAQVRFAEWTADGKLRHPVYLGLRDDKQPDEVMRESARESRSTRTPAHPDPQAPRRSDALLPQLRALESAHRDGAVELPGGGRLAVTNLRKPFWPRLKLTKGDLLRYYAEVAPWILPVVADRPLVMKRFPNGIGGQKFYQHRAPAVPAGVRTAVVPSAARRPQLVGGDLTTLLYMAQIAAISQDPWFSRVQTIEFADHMALDLDPADGLSFRKVLDVARWIRDELDALGAAGFPKTSGADGLHIYIPLPPHTRYEAGLLFCRIVATVVARKHPGAATVERSVRKRGPRVYVDYLQNALGKTLAAAYSARASEYAGVSTPLAWQEIDDGVRREEFTIGTVPARLRQVGDLWAGLRAHEGIDLSRAARYAEQGGARPPGRRRPARLK
ncbi:MAG: DNA ligase D [Acidobacteria bacterium]|nr:DNA ligase D [Acidobacteriota bacterium]